MTHYHQDTFQGSTLLLNSLLPAFCQNLGCSESGMHLEANASQMGKCSPSIMRDVHLSVGILARVLHRPVFCSNVNRRVLENQGCCLSGLWKIFCPRWLCGTLQSPIAAHCLNIYITSQHLGRRGPLRSATMHCLSYSTACRLCDSGLLKRRALRVLMCALQSSCCMHVAAALLTQPYSQNILCSPANLLSFQH